MYPADPADPSHGSFPPERRSAAAVAIPWSLVVVLIGAAVAFFLLRHRPLEQAYATLLATLNERGSEMEELRSGLSRLRREHQTLSSDRATLEGQLKQAVAEKNAALDELNRTKSELSTKLEAEIASGDIAIEQQGEQLVVDVADKILFPQGEAEVSERGREVLAQVASTLKSVKTHLFEVGGHTDSAPIVSPKVLERYPTNWELSAARAIHVVRYLEEQGVPGKQLAAAGHAQHRPVASNSSRYGRQRNRRIEIVLIRHTQR